MAVTLPPLDELNALDLADCAGALSRVFEPNPRLLEALARRRPFASYAAVLAAARAIVTTLSETERVILLASHPRIGARAGGLSPASRHEQGPVAPAAPEAELARLQDQYERRNGFRFVVFVRGRSRQAVLDVLRERVQAPRDVELARGIAEYLAICADRLGLAPAPS